MRCPCSSLQRDWWSRERRCPAPNFVLSFHEDLSWPLDPDVWEAAARHVLNRHENLRSRFLEVDGELWREVDSRSTARVWVEDLSALPADLAPRRAEAILAAHRDHNFDLDAHLVSMGAVLLPGGVSAISMAVHHLVADGISCEVIRSELSESYRVLAAGAASGLAPAPEPPAPTEPVAAARLAAAASRVVAAPPTHIPYDRPPTDPARFTTGVLTSTIDVAPAQLQRAALRARATASTLGLAALFSVLAELSGRPDVATRTIFSDRGAEHARAVGCLVRPSVVAITTGDIDDTELGRRSRAAFFAAEGDPVSLTAVLPQLPYTEADIDSMYVYFDAGADTTTFAGRPAREHVFSTPRVFTGIATSWDNLAIGLAASDSALGVRVEYNAETYDRPTAERVLDRYAATLRRLCET